VTDPLTPAQQMGAKVGDMLERVADSIEAGRLHYVNVPDTLRSLAAMYRLQGPEREEWLREIGVDPPAQDP